MKEKEDVLQEEEFGRDRGRVVSPESSLPYWSLYFIREGVVRDRLVVHNQRSIIHNHRPSW